MSALFARSSWSLPPAYVHNTSSVVWILLAIIAVACVAAGAWLIYTEGRGPGGRGLAPGVVLVVIGVVVGALFVF
jgi:hypothetical protein